ncbi:hypothetical protein [Burkholderia sp. IMCC1007]|uniref:hypothetical protein n=1 Tax=Burkholderia sp. IMCC1007 TaxID=3004104 RepID=UPI0022B2E66B|nr:hypothetical protein [Burkholderia sp. IMCC1007]
MTRTSRFQPLLRRGAPLIACLTSIAAAHAAKPPLTFKAADTVTARVARQIAHGGPARKIQALSRGFPTY